MAKTPSLKPYYIMGKVNLDMNLKINAESLEDALARSKSLKDSDFAECLGELNEGSVKITGVFSAE